MKLAIYLRNRGAQAHLAKALSVSPVLVHQWAYGKRPIPVRRCTEIERATSGLVKRQDLRPYDWQLIWPELTNIKESSDATTNR